VPTYRGQPATPVSDLHGIDLGGAPREARLLGSDRWHLLLFLSSGCDGCRPFLLAAADPVGAGLTTDEVVTVVTRDPEREDRDELAVHLGPGADVVMSSAAWADYRVFGPPFFVLVDGPGRRVATEGVAWAIGQVADHVLAAREGRATVEVPHLRPSPES